MDVRRLHKSSPCPTTTQTQCSSHHPPTSSQSLIVSYTGWPVAGPASRDSEEIILAEINLSEARRKRNWNAFNQVLRDRRTDVYDEMLGSGAKPGWY
jgi:hypothetical protein